MNKTRTHYRHYFRKYPDLVSVPQFMEMLGGISYRFARILIAEKRVEVIFIKPRYFIPKDSVIDYLLSEDYAHRRLKAKV